MCRCLRKLQKFAGEAVNTWLSYLAEARRGHYTYIRVHRGQRWRQPWIWLHRFHSSEWISNAIVHGALPTRWSTSPRPLPPNPTTHRFHTGPWQIYRRARLISASERVRGLVPPVPDPLYTFRQLATHPARTPQR